ncbi:uncharacterized protein LOC119595825 isoform X1 [Penaeus monodon]|uniref:uncharacterized protein LOC119595825 isoform X1 n=1 Tax=Penaeus monodon TaxID=6687 RepID=UPI0018A6FD74|nr:uncharacterized protein LOC119595825 isoform X1 [Penaeus monodon]
MDSSATLILFLWLLFASRAEAALEEIEATPTNTNGIEIGELSFMQLLLFMLVFLKLVTLYSLGVLPIEIDLGASFTGFTSERGLVDKDAEISTYLLDCPLQFVCDVDAWANRDHDYYLESLIASWFRNSNHTWQRPDSEVYGGHGTCKEMYPCPFDVQAVVGIRIPGSNVLPGAEEESYSFF